MVYHIIRADILLNTTQLAKYPRVLYDKPSNKMYILSHSRHTVCSKCDINGLEKCRYDTWWSKPGFVRPYIVL